MINKNMYKWNKTGSRMLVNTGYKTFDKQTNDLTDGNAITNTQYSNYIRAYNNTINPVGEAVAEGTLQKYDLKYFNTGKMTNSFIGWLEAVAENKPIILYEYFIYRNGYKEIIGWLIQDTKTNKIIGTEICKYSNIRIKNKLKVLSFCAKLLEV